VAGLDDERMAVMIVQSDRGALGTLNGHMGESTPVQCVFSSFYLISCLCFHFSPIFEKIHAIQNLNDLHRLMSGMVRASSFRGLQACT
jgi:hypothetical protein